MIKHILFLLAALMLSFSAYATDTITEEETDSIVVEEVPPMPWPLDVSSSSSNALGVTEILGQSEAGAYISASDSAGKALFCLPLFGLVKEDGTFSCYGRDLTAPVTVTAKNGFASLFSEYVTATVVVEDLNSEGEPWPLEVEPYATFLGATLLSGTSMEGASITVIDAADKSLICLPFLGTVSADGAFNCFGFGVTFPITVTAKSSPSKLFSNYTPSTVVVNEVTHTTPATN